MCWGMGAELPARVQVAHRLYAGEGRPLPRVTRVRLATLRKCAGKVRLGSVM
jgi:hypothetical protein